MTKKNLKFRVLANCPLRTVHQAETRAEGERWARANKWTYKAMGSSLCVIANKPLVRLKKEEPEQSNLDQPLTLGLLRSICLDLLVDSASSTKLVATAIIRRIDNLPSPAGHAIGSRARKPSSRKC